MVVGFDLNDSGATLTSLALREQCKFCRATGDEATTKGRVAPLSSRGALDHILNLVNSYFGDCNFCACRLYQMGL